MRTPPTIALVFFAAFVGLFMWGATETRAPKQAQTETHQENKPPIIAKTRAERIKIASAQWPAAPSYDFHFNALDPSFKMTANAGGLFDPLDEYWGLPRDEGYEEVSAYCGACHSLGIVMQQTATPDRWRELLIWMVEKQGMAPMHPEDEKIVQAYLSKNFSTR